jgi:hypothetical protein
MTLSHFMMKKFKGKKGEWTNAQNFSEKIGLLDQSLFVIISEARITPDGKYFFFCYFKRFMVY